MTLNIAIIGAGIAGITAARTLAKAGHHVQVFEKSRGPGGRMSTRESNFGTFDHGAQYFTVRDPRFSLAIQAVPGTTEICRPWSANAVRVLDPLGHVFEAARSSKEAHFVAKPGMNALVRHWAEPLGKAIHNNTQITRLERGAKGLWTLHTDDHKFAGFDHVLLAIPSVQAENLLKASGKEAANTQWLKAMDAVDVAPCWTMMVAFPQCGPTQSAHWSTVECCTQHSPPHCLVGPRIVQARTRQGRALDGASQRRLVNRAHQRHRRPCASQTLARLCRTHRDSRRTRTHASAPLAVCQNHFTTRRVSPIQPSQRLGHLRRLALGPPRGRCVCLRP